MAATETDRVLRNIAETLGIAVSAFTELQVAQRDPMSDTVELLRLFDRIHDEQQRRACIEFVRTITL